MLTPFWSSSGFVVRGRRAGVGGCLLRAPRAEEMGGWTGRRNLSAFSPCGLRSQKESRVFRGTGEAPFSSRGACPPATCLCLPDFLFCSGPDAVCLPQLSVHLS